MENVETGKKGLGLPKPPLAKEVNVEKDLEELKATVAKQAEAIKQMNPEAPTVEPSLKETRDHLNSQPKVKIIIPSTEQDKDPVPVGINGYVYLIARDKPVEVPEDVAKVLDNARMTTYVQRRREDGEGNELHPVESLRIPYHRQ